MREELDKALKDLEIRNILFPAQMKFALYCMRDLMQKIEQLEKETHDLREYLNSKDRADRAVQSDLPVM